MPFRPVYDSTDGGDGFVSFEGSLQAEILVFSTGFVHNRRH
jgi:hypothetical protein